ncbi:fluoride efflux transporter CrcB [Actinomadura fulvescens]|uniref:fluoride efflux transporter CrcB n=1 Tax=Actinomadura fulvescens TaxID=46160 RepID=UPI0031D90AAA
MVEVGRADSDAAVPLGRERASRRRGLVLLAIAVGGGLGSCARYLVGVAVSAEAGRIPWATLLINVTGCLALGVLMVGVIERWPPSRYVRPFWGIGFLGGFTTFSTHAVEVRDLVAGGALAQAAVYGLGSVAAGVAAVWAGAVVARRVLRPGAGEGVR